MSCKLEKEWQENPYSLMTYQLKLVGTLTIIVFCFYQQKEKVFQLLVMLIIGLKSYSSCGIGKKMGQQSVFPTLVALTGLLQCFWNCLFSYLLTILLTMQSISQFISMIYSSVYGATMLDINSMLFSLSIDYFPAVG